MSTITQLPFNLPAPWAADKSPLPIILLDPGQDPSQYLLAAEATLGQVRSGFFEFFLGLASSHIPLLLWSEVIGQPTQAVFHQGRGKIKHMLLMREGALLPNTIGSNA